MEIDVNYLGRVFTLIGSYEPYYPATLHDDEEGGFFVAWEIYIKGTVKKENIIEKLGDGAIREMERIAYLNATVKRYDDKEK